MFIIGTDTFLISPLLTTLSSLYHIDTSISGWMVSAYTIGYALFALVSGPISDGRDRKKVMVYGWVAFTISTFLCGFANSFALMFLFRFLAGISASFVTSQVWASIPVVVEKKNIVQVMGYATAGLSVSQMAGVPIGGYLAGISWRSPFFTISAASLVLLLLINFYMPIVKRFGLQKTFKTELTTIVILYLVLLLVHHFWVAEVLLTIIYVNNGFIFPLFMTTLQSTVENARSTISSLSNAVMYLGETIASIVGGVLFEQFAGFFGIAVFAAVMIALSLLLYYRSF